MTKESLQRILTAQGLAAFLCLAGCDLNIINQSDQQQDQNRGPTDGTATNGAVTDFECRRIEQSDGNASSCTLLWKGAVGPFNSVAVREVDALESRRPNVVSGTPIDPGPGGEGGGRWNIRLEDDTGAVLATTSVELDS